MIFLSFLYFERCGLSAVNQAVQNGTLFDHLIETEDAAQSRLEVIVPALAKAAGATEALKAADQMKWVGIMNACKAQAEEVIFQEIIFA